MPADPKLDQSDGLALDHFDGPWSARQYADHWEALLREAEVFVCPHEPRAPEPVLGLLSWPDYGVVCCREDCARKLWDDWKATSPEGDCDCCCQTLPPGPRCTLITTISGNVHLFAVVCEYCLDEEMEHSAAEEPA